MTQKKGFTLIELLVVVLIIGILASIGVPGYRKTMETTKAQDAVALGNMIGMANRMYMADNTALASGLLSTGCTNNCAAATGACRLTACKYLAQHDWDASDYDFRACSGATGGGCCSPGAVACVSRAGGGAPYNTWVYTFTDGGSCAATGTNVPPCPGF